MIKQLRAGTRLLGTVVGAALLLVAAYSGASAAPLTFVWNPAGATPALPGGLIGPANNFNVADFADITLTGGGNFSEKGYLTVLQFLNGGAPAPSPGLNTTYSLYFGFNGTGSGVSVPSSGNASTGPFTSLDYTLFATPNSTPTVGVSPGTVTISGNVPSFVLAYGSLISGTATLTNTGTGAQPFSPTSNLIESFHVCTAPGQGNNQRRRAIILR